MRVIILIYFIVNLLESHQFEFENELWDLRDVFLESLKADLIESSLTPNSKQNIDERIDTFIQLVSRSQLRKLSRSKRSVEFQSLETKTTSIDIHPELNVPVEHPNDLRLFAQNDHLYAVALENQNTLSIFHHQNERFEKVKEQRGNWTTNIGLISFGSFSFVVVGNETKVTVFKFITSNKVEFNGWQTIDCEKPKHLVLWKQPLSIYLSITESNGNVQLYRWLGNHFDYFQTVLLEGVKKTVPFIIHGSNYLAMANEEELEGYKSYSNILKYDYDRQVFKPHQRLLTNGCSDIKYFRANLHGDDHHFLIVVHAESKSVIYEYVKQYFIAFQTVRKNILNWQPVEDQNGNAALIGMSNSTDIYGYQYDGWTFSESNLMFNYTGINDIETLHVFNLFNKELLVTIGPNNNSSINIFSINFTSINPLKQQYSALLDWCQNSLKQLDTDQQIFFKQTRHSASSASLVNSEEILIKLEDTLSYKNDTIILNKNFQVNSLILSDDTNITALNSQFFQSTIDNTLNIEKGFSVDKLEFKEVEITNNFKPSKINGKDVTSYIATNENIPLESLEVCGSITFKNNLKVAHQLNNVSINKDNVLLNGVEQSFSNCSVENLEVSEMTVTLLNGMDVTNISTIKISNITHLKVKELQLGGLMNRVDLRTLFKRALKKVGNNVLEVPYTFDDLEVENLYTLKLSNKTIPDDLIVISGGEYFKQDAAFSDISIDEFDVTHSINHIDVLDGGRFNVLLKNNNEPQQVYTKKLFKNLTVMNPIQTSSKIEDPQLQLLNPMKVVDRSLKIDSDVEIVGRVTVSQMLTMQDLKANNYPTKSMINILENGIHLTDSLLDSHISFTRPLKVDTVNAEKVNSFTPNNWLLKSTDQIQNVSGEKTFIRNVHLDGDLHLNKINNEIVPTSQKILLSENDVTHDILQLDSLVARQGISANFTQSNTIIVDGNAYIGNLTSINLKLNGLLNNKQNFHNLVKKDGKFLIHGKKQFETLQVENLKLSNDSDIYKLFQQVVNNHITIDSLTNLHLINNISIEHLEFDGMINNLTVRQFNDLLNLNTTVLMDSVMNYDEVEVLGDVYISDDSINGKDLKLIEMESVKIDENHHFDSINIGKSLKVNTVHLEGNIINLDLDTIVLQNSNEPLKVEDKSFLRPITINGSLQADSIGTVNFTRFCSFAQTNSLKSMKLKNATFARGLNVSFVNDFDVQNPNLWFVDQPTNISGTVYMDQTKINTLVVQGYLNGTKLSVLSKNYLSKTKDQLIQSSIGFGTVKFSNISIPLLDVKETINGKPIELFDAILLQNVSQQFNNEGLFESLNIDQLLGQFTINGLNIESEIMRYDQPNIMTNSTIFENLDIKYLNLNGTIQKLDVLDWLDNAVLTNGTFNIQAKTTLKNVNFKRGLNLRGKLNGEEFRETTIMLENLPQIVTGRQVFLANETKFRTLKVAGAINEVNMTDLVIEANPREVVFEKDVTVKHLNIKEYQNISIKQLLNNVSQLSDFTQFNYKLNNLLDKATIMEESLKEQRHYFKYYKELITLPKTYDMFGLTSRDNIFRIVSFSYETNKNVFKSFEWNNQENTFVLTGESIEAPVKPNFIQQVVLAKKDYIYIEHPEISNYGHFPFHRGKIVEIINGTKLHMHHMFIRNATTSLAVFTNSSNGKSCIAFTDVTESKVDILCLDNDEYIRQRSLRVNRAYKVETLETDDGVFMFVAKYGNEQMDPSVAVYEMTKTKPDFDRIQTIFEDGQLNGLASANIANTPYLVLSFGPQEYRIDAGWISIKSFDKNVREFVDTQYIPITAPLEVHFITQSTFEPLLLVASLDARAPLQAFRYEGIAGFKRILKGASLPSNCAVRVIKNGHFLAVIDTEHDVATILGAIIKSPVKLV